MQPIDPALLKARFTFTYSRVFDEEDSQRSYELLQQAIAADPTLCDRIFKSFSTTGFRGESIYTPFWVGDCFTSVPLLLFMLEKYPTGEFVEDLRLVISTMNNPNLSNFKGTREEIKQLIEQVRKLRPEVEAPASAAAN